MGCQFQEKDGIVIMKCEDKIMGIPEDSLMINGVYDLIEKDKKKLVIDFSNVKWINSRGLGILITIYTALNNRNGHLRLTNLNDKVSSLLDKCRMFMVFSSCDSVEEAIEDINKNELASRKE